MIQGKSGKRKLILECALQINVMGRIYVHLVCFRERPNYTPTLHFSLPDLDRLSWGSPVLEQALDFLRRLSPQPHLKNLLQCITKSSLTYTEMLSFPLFRGLIQTHPKPRVHNNFLRPLKILKLAFESSRIFLQTGQCKA